MRLRDPGDVLGGWMLAIALVGLAVNVGAGVMLSRARRHSLNVEAAFRHVFADLLGSLGVAVAAVVILTTGWVEADPLVSIVIGVLILVSAWSILRDSTEILLESTPRGIDAEALGRRLASAPGVVEVHDLHVWTITSGSLRSRRTSSCGPARTATGGVASSNGFCTTSSGSSTPRSRSTTPATSGSSRWSDSASGRGTRSRAERPRADGRDEPSRERLDVGRRHRRPSTRNSLAVGAREVATERTNALASRSSHGNDGMRSCGSRAARAARRRDGSRTGSPTGANTMTAPARRSARTPAPALPHRLCLCPRARRKSA